MSRLLAWLESDPQRKFAIFAIGTIIFMLGISTIAIAEFRVDDEWLRARMAFAGLAGCGIGGLIALTGYLGLVAGRLSRFFRDK